MLSVAIMVVNIMSVIRVSVIILCVVLLRAESLLC